MQNRQDRQKVVNQAAGLTRMPGAPIPRAPDFGNIGQRLDKGKNITGKAQKKLTGMGYSQDQISRASQAGGMEGFQNSLKSSLRGMEQLPKFGGGYDGQFDGQFDGQIMPTKQPQFGGSFPMPGSGATSAGDMTLQPYFPKQPQQPANGATSAGDMTLQPYFPKQPQQPANGATSGKVPGMYPGMPYDDYMQKINNNEHVGYQQPQKSPFDMSKNNFSGDYPKAFGAGQAMPGQTFRRPGRINTLRQGMM